MARLWVRTDSPLAAGCRPRSSSCGRRSHPRRPSHLCAGSRGRPGTPGLRRVRRPAVGRSIGARPMGSVARCSVAATWMSKSATSPHMPDGESPVTITGHLPRTQPDVDQSPVWEATEGPVVSLTAKEICSMSIPAEPVVTLHVALAADQQEAEVAATRMARARWRVRTSPPERCLTAPRPSRSHRPTGPDCRHLRVTRAAARAGIAAPVITSPGGAVACQMAPCPCRYVEPSASRMRPPLALRTGRVAVDPVMRTKP